MGGFGEGYAGVEAEPDYLEAAVLQVLDVGLFVLEASFHQQIEGWVLPGWGFSFPDAAANSSSVK